MCDLQTSGLRVRQHIRCVNEVFSTHMLMETRSSAGVGVILDFVLIFLSLIGL